MSKYNTGDRFVIEIAEDRGGCYRIQGFNGLNLLVFDEKGLDRLERIDSDYVNENFGELQDEAYNKGLEDAWELAKKICYEMTYLTYRELKEIFKLPSDIKCNVEILYELTPQEALSKIKKYEESKEIKVGDVVYADDEPDSYGVVTWITSCKTLAYVLWYDGSCGKERTTEELHKVGKNINDKFQKLLDELKEGVKNGKID